MNILIQTLVSCPTDILVYLPSAAPGLETAQSLYNWHNSCLQRAPLQYTCRADGCGRDSSHFPGSDITRWSDRNIYICISILVRHERNLVGRVPAHSNSLRPVPDLFPAATDPRRQYIAAGRTGPDVYEGRVADGPGGRDAAVAGGVPIHGVRFGGEAESGLQQVQDVRVCVPISADRAVRGDRANNHPVLHDGEGGHPSGAAGPPHDQRRAAAGAVHERPAHAEHGAADGADQRGVHDGDVDAHLRAAELHHVPDLDLHVHRDGAVHALLRHRAGAAAVGPDPDVPLPAAGAGERVAAAVQGAVRGAGGPAHPRDRPDVHADTAGGLRRRQVRAAARHRGRAHGARLQGPAAAAQPLRADQAAGGRAAPGLRGGAGDERPGPREPAALHLAAREGRAGGRGERRGGGAAGGDHGLPVQPRGLRGRRRVAVLPGAGAGGRRRGHARARALVHRLRGRGALLHAGLRQGRHALRLPLHPLHRDPPDAAARDPAQQLPVQRAAHGARRAPAAAVHGLLLRRLHRGLHGADLLRQDRQQPPLPQGVLQLLHRRRHRHLRRRHGPHLRVPRALRPRERRGPRRDGPRRPQQGGRLGLPPAGQEVPARGQNSET